MLDCFSIGNEPNAYNKTFEAYFANWKPHYDAILKAVPNAMFDGPSVYAGSKNLYPEKLANAMVPGGHMAMISDHYYVMGDGRAAEKNLDNTRAHFLSNDSDISFGKSFAAVGSKLMAKGIPYRIDELNNCSHGGAKGISDTYAASLWALDATHWWAAHHILGLNYHTGENVGPDGSIVPINYSAFFHQANGKGLGIRPASYGYLAFTQGASGRPLEVTVAASSAHSFTAYAYRANDGTVYVTLINKTFAGNAEPVLVSTAIAARRRCRRGAANGFGAKEQRHYCPGGHHSRRCADQRGGRLDGPMRSSGYRLKPESRHQSGAGLRDDHSLPEIKVIGSKRRLRFAKCLHSP